VLLERGERRLPAPGDDGVVAAPAGAVLGLLGLARIHLAVGDPPGARVALAQADRVIRSRPDLGGLPAEVAEMQAEIARLPIGVAGASTLTSAERFLQLRDLCFQ
jgi:hypothetical protein